MNLPIKYEMYKRYPNFQGIYRIVNITNNKWYIGSSINIRQRIHQHLRDLRQNTHDNAKLQNAWNKYGKDAFEFWIVELVENCEDLLPVEQEWLNKHRPHITGYNIAIGATGPRHSKETRRKWLLKPLGEN